MTSAHHSASLWRLIAPAVLALALAMQAVPIHAQAQPGKFKCPPPARTFPLYDHTATLLPGGKVLVAGGRGLRNHILGSFMCDPTDTLNTAWLYDPARNAWSPAALLTGRFGQFTSTLLPSGKVVLLTTGEKVQLYDPASNTWTASPSKATMNQRLHAAALLPSGKVLVTGGLLDSSRRPEHTSQSRLYDPVADAWADAAPTQITRWRPTATPLPNGKVLVAGRPEAKPLDPASAEVYDPTANTWSPTGPAHAARIGHTATLLPSGKVLVIGPPDISPVDKNASVTAELYDPSANVWSPVSGPKAVPRSEHTATLLSSGKVLVAGGSLHFGESGIASAELYDPKTDTWSSAGLMTLARHGHTATPLPNGKVLLVGGGSNGDSTPATNAELYDPASNTWAFTGPMGEMRRDDAASPKP
jgi:hypothetical protein